MWSCKFGAPGPAGEGYTRVDQWMWQYIRAASILYMKRQMTLMRSKSVSEEAHIIVAST